MSLDFHCFKFKLFGVRILLFPIVRTFFSASSSFDTLLGQILGLFEGFVLWMAGSEDM